MWKNLEVSFSFKLLMKIEKFDFFSVASEVDKGKMIF